MCQNLLTRALLIALISALVSACGAGAAFDKAKQINTVTGYDEFLRDYADSEYILEARELREQSFFNQAESQNSVEAYQEYLKRYPKGKFVSQARSAQDELEFAQARQKNTLASYNSYLSQYPKGKFAAQARSAHEELLFEQAEQKSTLVAYDAYLSEYPDGKFAAPARSAHEELLFEQAEQKSTLAAYDAYLSEYPNGKFVIQAHRAQDELAFTQARQENTLAAYDSYLSDYPNGKFTIQVSKAREELFFTQAEQASTVQAYEQYLEQYPQGVHADTSRERLISLKRSIIWSYDNNFNSDLASASSLLGVSTNELKALPLYYFVYLYTQAARGQSLILPLQPRPLQLEAPPYPDLPPEPELTRGEFETSLNFESRKSKVLQEWQQSRQAKIDAYEAIVAKLKSSYEMQISNWQESVRKYQDDIAQLRLRTQDPDLVFSWQQRAVQIALSVGLNLDRLQYEADNELFNYSISSNLFASPWRGKLSVPIAQAHDLKADLEKASNLQLHFYLSSTGELELRRITNLASNTGVDTQNITSQPVWQPTEARLARLELTKLNISSNVYSDQARIGGINYGPTPLELDLAPGGYKISVNKTGYETYSELIDVSQDRDLQVELDSYKRPKMMYIPAGSFLMGDIQGSGHDAEKPVHRVSIKAFLMGVTEVTFAQWDACVADGGCSHRPDDEAWWSRDNRPVINVSWRDSQQYVKWITAKTGEQYRLPSEAEWEYAVRAGSETEYSWGNTVSYNYGNYGGKGRTVPVASFVANPFGLYDMHGNVQEWTQDCWNPSYKGAPNDGSAWLSGDCDLRIVRGSAWPSNTEFSLRSAFRNWESVGGILSRSSRRGFRLARTLD